MLLCISSRDTSMRDRMLPFGKPRASSYPIITMRRSRSLTTRISADRLRSARWFAPDDLRSFGHRSRFMQIGYSPEDWLGRPVIAIINTWSDINPCHAHFKHRVEDVKRGIAQAGGVAIGIVNSARIGAAFIGPVLATTLLAWSAPVALYAALALVGLACVPLARARRASIQAPR